MSIIVGPGGSVVVRKDEAEIVGRSPATFRLLADSSQAHGHLSTVEVSLRNGSDGARPHHHTGSSEMFYVLGGTVELLSGDQVMSANAGDLIVIPPNITHAFAAPPGRDADLLIVIAPGVERFEYFRLVARIADGRAAPESLREVQERYDNYFTESATWNAARSQQH